jgi:hypothetical protein
LLIVLLTYYVFAAQGWIHCDSWLGKVTLCKEHIQKTSQIWEQHSWYLFCVIMIFCCNYLTGSAPAFWVSAAYSVSSRSADGLLVGTLGVLSEHVGQWPHSHLQLLIRTCIVAQQAKASLAAIASPLPPQHKQQSATAAVALPSICSAKQKQSELLWM